MNKIEFLHRIALNEKGQAITIAFQSLQGLKAVWYDTLSIFVLGAKRRNKLEYTWEYPNGSMILFQVFDSCDLLGLQRDYLYTWSTMNKDTLDILYSRTSKMVFLEMVNE